MSRRIFGLETEFGITCVTERGRGLAAEEIARYMFRPVVEWGRSSNVFLPNASRLYLDVGSHPEYATAECDSVDQLITHDRAGERHMTRLVREAQEQLRLEGVPGVIHCFKNNADSAGNSFGCHENYSVIRRGDFHRLTRGLIPFLVSRQVLVGAGSIRQSASGAAYCFSQRADHLWEAVSSSTTRSRPMINTRDEPHADPEKYRRLHVISGDSNMAEPTVALKVGAMDIVLRMLDQGVILTDLSLENPMRAIRAISQDMTGTVRVDLMDGRALTAVELQELMLEQVLAFLERDGATATDERTIDLWTRGLAAVRAQDPSLVARELDWAIKFQLLDTYRAKNDLDWADPRLARLELAYHDIDPDHGVYFKMVRSGLIDTIVAEDAVVEAMDSPPSSTRASLRGRFITAARAARRDYSVDWVHLKLNEEPITVTLKDPFSADDEEAEELIQALEAAAAESPGA